MPQRSFPTDLSATTLFDALPDPCLLLNTSNQILAWNTAFAEEQATCPELARRCETVMQSSGAEARALHINATQSYHIDVRALDEGGDRLLRLRRVFPNEPDGDALRAFAAGAGHDLQEPLRKILAFSTLLQKRQADALGPEGEQSLAFISDAAQRMRTLVNEALAHIDAAVRPLTFEPISLNALLDDVLKSRAAMVNEAGATFDRTDLPTVSGDRMLLQQALAALVDNALKFRRGSNVKIQVSAARTGAQHRIEIRDDGIGVDPELAEKLFTPFGRLHSRETYPGAALGLARVKLIVERHGGEIWLEPGTGEGACFAFTLPVSDHSDDA
ncbi:ATP-binding protein [Oceanicaulis sp. MMSF_3324]|uniref:sensor histidine kinase n=1 Tax=Oceanicaulis sp. MMSF_3324 TaxID=3046702 RepID=UPI00273F192A|nr:ATP-binding protein [Oceanicaulis sp. MMSF_3324]